MGIKNWLADLTIDSMYAWKKLDRGRVAHLVPKRNTGLTLVSHCGLKGPWWEPAPGLPPCVRCEAEHARLTHDAPADEGESGAH